MTKIEIPKDKPINIDVLYHTLKANLEYEVYFKNPNKQNEITVQKNNLLINVKLKEKVDHYEIKTNAFHGMWYNYTTAIMIGLIYAFTRFFLSMLLSDALFLFYIIMIIFAKIALSPFEKEIVEFLKSYEFV